MLRSTHKAKAPTPAPPPLAPGWTEHKAPTGHAYYYNSETKQSTYTRPTAQPQQPAPPTIDYSTSASAHPNGASFSAQQWTGFNGPHGQNAGPPGGRGHQDRRPRPQDRPKHKFTVPGCEPWVLIQTRLGRRFVHNTETGESLWRFPEHVMKAVVDWDVQQLQAKWRRERGEVSGEEESGRGNEGPDDEGVSEDGGGRPRIVKPAAVAAEEDEEASEEEYEEVEVTDDEGGGGEEEGEEGPSKRQRMDEDEDESDNPLEFNEDDIAYQLQAMGQDYGLDEGEYGMAEGEEWEEGAEGLPLTEEDSKALFRDLLDDLNINPYRTWEQIVEDGRIIDDDRYTALPNTKSRRDTFSDWSREKIQVLREQREREAKRDPRIPYLAFLQQKATPKLYWPEFKRKYKKEPEMRDTKVSDKDREKCYREHVKRLQFPESTLKSDLSAALKSLPLSALNRSTSINNLPPSLVTDLRYISLRPEIRDVLIETYIATLQPPPETAVSAEEEAEAAAKRQDRERREHALAERERRVQQDKAKQRRELEYGKGRLREEEWEIQRAMNVGMGGLRGQLQGLEGGQKPDADANADAGANIEG